MKSLPKPNAKDDVERLKRLKRISLFKEGTPNYSFNAKQRLEAALSLKRYWSHNAWKSVFMDNPIMKQFSISLIWVSIRKGSC